jgi:DmsE family decaheme c-type cytochrome
VQTRHVLRLVVFGIGCCLAPTLAGAKTTDLPHAVAAHGQTPRVTQAKLASQKIDAQSQAQGYVGAETCVTCHDSEGKSLSHTEHARAANPRTPMAAMGCESCHGPGKAHVDGDGDKSKIRVFPKMASRDVSQVCISCHDRSEHAQWQGSAHDARNLSCITCHSVHDPKSEQAQLKKVSQIELCGSCHRTQTLKMQRVNHMPLREGKMECTTCHNPHGSVNLKLLRVGSYINESCISCHTEKRGPFLFEHPPGRESCVTCHDPHGSTNERLLVAKVPMLCQRCHIGTNHPSTIYDNAQVKAGSVRIVGRGCVSCHENIHGSNSPSGNAFHR